MPTIYLLSLGCAKNEVDSQNMSALLTNQGFIMTGNPEQAQVIIVNTCGFIEDAQKESIAAFLDLAAFKEQQCRLLIAVGCLVEKFEDDLRQSLPEIDLFLGSQNFGQIGHIISKALKLPPCPIIAEDRLYQERIKLKPTVSAYLKIAEGCDKHCTYCLIPKLRGPYLSRKPQDILAEATALAAQGVQELIILAQDICAYGHDLADQPKLANLLDDLAALPFTWIRLLYAYPEDIDEPLLQVMAKHDNICNYLDIPIQHSDDRILKLMGRKTNQAQIKQKIALIKQYLPDAALRSTMMVGFPGEDEAALSNLLDFIKEIPFTWLGVFAFSPQEDTPAFNMPNQIDEQTKIYRRDLVIDTAAFASGQYLEQYIGKQLKVLIEGPALAYPPDWYAARSAYQAPQIDGQVLIYSKQPLATDSWLDIIITDIDGFDLIAKPR